MPRIFFTFADKTAPCMYEIKLVMVITTSTSNNLSDRFAAKLVYRKKCADMQPVSLALT